MSDTQAAPAPEVNEKEAQARLRAFEVGISHICNGLGITYGQLAKQANEKFKFVEKEADAENKLAPWLIDVIVAEAEKTQT